MEYHASQSDQERLKTHSNFLNDELEVIVATSMKHPPNVIAQCLACCNTTMLALIVCVCVAIDSSIVWHGCKQA
jgi:hypothetical protein